MILKYYERDKLTVTMNTRDTLHVYARNVDVDQHNNTILDELPSQKITIQAIDSTDAKRNTPLKLPSNPVKTGGMRSSLTVAVGARIMLTKNINTEDGLVNGAQGTIVTFHPEPPTDPDTFRAYSPQYILVDFDGETTGERTRTACQQFCQQHPKAVPISRDEVKFKLSFHTKSHVTRRQFPLTLCWACTIHKVQGQTMQKIVIDCKGRFSAGQFYVAVSRVTSLAGLHLINFTPDKIISNKRVEAVLHKMTALEVPVPAAMQALLYTHYKVALLNVQSWPAHHEDLLHNNIIMSSDIVALTETWLCPDDFTLTLPDFNTYNKHRLDCYKMLPTKTHTRHDVYHHGGVSIAVKKQHTCVQVWKHQTEPDMEYNVIILHPEGLIPLCVTVVYRPKPHVSDQILLHKMEQLLMQLPHLSIPTLVMGDFNIDLANRGTTSSNLVELMAHYGFIQLATEPTTRTGSIIDQVYYNHSPDPTILSIVPTYFTLHHLLLLAVPLM